MAPSSIITEAPVERISPVDMPGYPELPQPAFPPALDFDPDSFIRSYEQADVLEKAVPRYRQSSASFGSDTTTLRSSTAWTEMPLSKIIQEPYQLPPKKHMRIIRAMRLTIFTVYRRIFSVIVIVNLVGLFLLLRNGSHNINLDSLAVWASTNFLVSILIRQDYIVNLIFRTAWIVPWRVPLRLRRMIARVYTYGGIHTGAAVAGTMWFSTFTVLVTISFIQKRSYTLPTLVLAWVILVLLLTICLLAFPSLRSRHHNTFEFTHRLLGWTTIALFWAQFILLAHQNSASSSSSLGSIIVHSPTFYNLTLMTLMILHPWLRLRKWTFYPEVLSAHAVRLHFTHPVHKFSCLNISSSPLAEWHPFATFPSTTPALPTSTKTTPTTGASLVISAAGDWTRSIIAQASTSPSKSLNFYVRGYPRAGVLSLSTLFSRIVLVTTGSGIGPCLSSLLDRPTGQFIRLIWSTRSPLLTYGTEILALTKAQDEDAVVIDTDSMGRPDLVRVAMKVYKEVGAEAVFVLSNEKVTRKVVYALESRGIPAFGPIWDS